MSCTTAYNYLDPTGPRYAGSSSGDSRHFDGTIGVVSFNIKESEKIDQAVRELREHEDLMDADIFLMQELDSTGAQTLAGSLQCNYVYYPASHRSNDAKDIGNAILSKWPILTDRKVLLPHNHPISRSRRIAVAAVVRIQNLDVLTISLHTQTYWPGGIDEMESQADSIVRSIPADAEYVVVGGDFNTAFPFLCDMVERIFEANGFIRASRNLGTTAKVGPLRATLDHIYTRGFRVLSLGKLEHTQASDHFPIWVSLAREERQR